MCQTFFFIPDRIFGVPVFGLGWLLLVWGVVSTVWVAWSAKKSGWSAAVKELAPFLLVTAAAILFLFPRLEVRSPTGTVLGLPIRGYGTLLLCAVSLFAGTLAGFVVTRHIASSVHRLQVATEHISEGEFGYDPRIRTQDEIGVLSQAFLAMGRRLRQLEEMYLDASPLTRLPGGIAIENVLKKRLESGRPVAFCMADLDNFKAFNDHYGYAKGSEVIKETALLIEAAVRAKGSPDDFVGHVGGDDFVFITTPELARRVCEEVIAGFDKRIPGFYDPEDRKRGSIPGKTRQGVEQQFPIMTVSMAVVTNERRKLDDPLQVSEIAAELKTYAKSLPGSVFVVDRRNL